MSLFLEGSSHTLRCPDFSKDIANLFCSDKLLIIYPMSYVCLKKKCRALFFQAICPILMSLFQMNKNRKYGLGHFIYTMIQYYFLLDFLSPPNDLPVDICREWEVYLGGFT